jgi:hypothetical protein
MHNNATTAQRIARRAYISIKEHNKANNPVRVPLNAANSVSQTEIYIFLIFTMEPRWGWFHRLLVFIDMQPLRGKTFNGIITAQCIAPLH